MYHAEITGWGMCVPPARLTNDDLATFLDTSDEWIVSRSGIRERRVSHVNFSELALVSARRALAAADMDPGELDLILLASLTNDSYCPNTAAIVQDALDARKAAALDINTACTGFLYGMHLCKSLIATGQHKKILLIGGEYITHYLNWSQRSSAILFGDACGAVILEPSEKPVGMLASRIGCEADAKNAIQITNFGSAYERLTDDFLYVEWNFDGREVFKRAVKCMAQACVDVLEEAGVGIDEVAVVVPPSGEQADSRCACLTARHTRRESDHQCRQVRQHLSGHDSGRPCRSAGRRPNKAWRLRAFGGIRRRLDLGRGPFPLGRASGAPENERRRIAALRQDRARTPGTPHQTLSGICQA